MANKLTVEVVAAFGLLALGVGVYCHFQLVNLRRSTEALNLESARLDGRMKAVAALQSKADRAAADNAADNAAANPKPGTGKADAGSGARESGADNFLREATENPEMRQALKKYFNGEFRLHYVQFAKITGLSDVQMNQLGDAYFKKWSDQLDLARAARLSGGTPDPDSNEAYKSLVKNASDAYDDAIRAAVGQAAFQQLHEFDRTYSARVIANEVAAGAAAASAPLTPEQTDQLLRLVADGSPDYRQGGSVNSVKLDWDRVMTQATSMFSPAQLSSLNAIHAGQDMQSINALYQIAQPTP